MLKVVDSNRGTEFWPRVSASSYSGYTASPPPGGGRSSTAVRCQCSEPARCSLSLLRDLGCPLETLRNDPPQHLSARLRGDFFAHFQNKFGRFGGSCPTFCLLSSLPKSLAGWRKFGNELKAELWEGLLVSVVITREGKARQATCSHKETQVWDRRGSRSSAWQTRNWVCSAECPHPGLAFGEVMTHQCINHSSNKCSLRFFSKKKK